MGSAKTFHKPRPVQPEFGDHHLHTRDSPHNGVVSPDRTLLRPTPEREREREECAVGTPLTGACTLLDTLRNPEGVTDRTIN